MNPHCCDGCGCLNKCFISYVFGEGGNLHCKKETTPLTHSFTNTSRLLNANHPGLQCVCETPLNPMKPLPLTDAQKLTRGYCGHIQRKSTVKTSFTKKNTLAVLMEEWTNRKKDRLIAAMLTSFWLQAESGCKPVKGVAFCFWSLSVRTRGTQQERRGGQKYFVLTSLCTAR